MNFNGRATVTLGVSAEPLALPARKAPKLPLADLDLSRFYSSLEDIGLRYSGDFVMQSASRILNTATVTARHIRSPLLIYPATLDATFQGIFAAYCFPGDGRLRSGYLPTSIERVRVDISALECARSTSDSELVHTADCYVRSTSGSRISGDVDIFSGPDHSPQLQIEGLTCTSLERNLAKNDRKTFAQTIWMPDVSTDLPVGAPWCPEDKELAEIIERVVYFYLRNLRNEISPEEIPSMDEHFQCLMDWALNHVLPRVESGRHPRVKAAWKSDTPEMVALWKARFRGKIDMDLITALGEALPAVCRGTLPTLQVLMQNDMLNRFYKEGLGFPQANSHLASLVSRFSHRYPRIKVLEIGAGTGGATAHVLEALSPQFESYTYTDISPGFFENARYLFHEYLQKMTFKTLDVERDPIDQGYEEESFDLIIASNVLHATKVLANTLQNCRRLLRPGGQLMLMEITSAEETIRLGFITAGLPGWWLGRADGRVHAPTITEAQWDRILAENGFSGVDVARRDFEECHYNTVMATQAVDDRVAVLREPLSMGNVSGTGTSLVAQIKNFVVIGGKYPQHSTVARGLVKLLQPFADALLIVDTPENLSSECFISGTAALCLADLDDPVWKDMNENKFKGMKRVFLGSSHILWATRGRLAESPYSNMTVGMGRSFLLENPHVSLQFLDLDCSGETEADAVVLAESLLRMTCLSSPEFGGVLWSSEHELCMKEGRTYTPRILSDDDLNDHLNSESRPIERDIYPLTSCVELKQQDAHFALVESEEHANCAGAQGSCRTPLVRVHVSSLFPFLARGGDSFFICVGSELNSDAKFLFLSQSNASVVCASHPRVEWSPTQDDGDALNDILTYFIAENLVTGTEGTLWVHEADDRLASYLKHCSETQRLDLLLSTSCSRQDPLRSFIHPRTPARDLVNILPAGLARCVNVGCGNAQDFENLTRTLREDGRAGVHSLMTKFRGRQSVNLQLPRHTILEMLTKAFLHVSSIHTRTSSGDSSTAISEVNAAKGLPAADKGPAHVFNWRVQGSVPALIQSFESMHLFFANRTYFLVSLTGEVSLSLCRWMVGRRARHLAITSRNPDIPPAALQDLEQHGAHVRVFSLDVSNRKALRQVYSEICDTMPPVAGMANTAIVLSDRAFKNTTLNNFQAMLAPKVQGTKNLNDLFFSTNLEFFVLFSSIASVVSSKGQSNYEAANLFMHSLARQRRNHGVAASVMDITMLLGVGYVARSLDQYESQMKQYSYMAISEPEFHNIFAAAILAGKPGSDHSPEIITGVGPDADAPWTRDPRFSHYVCYESKSAEVAKAVDPSGNVLSQLAQSESSEALSILESAFSRKVELMLQLEFGSIDVQAPLVRVGIDSLVAVELRSWFLRELDIDMPVLKFLNGASVSDICKDALARLSILSRPPQSPDSLVKGDNSSVPETASLSSEQLSPVNDGLGAQAAEFDFVLDSPGGSAPDALPDTAMTTPANEVSDSIAQSSEYERVGPMSIGQTRLFFLQEYSQKKSAYTVIMLGKAQNTINIARLQNALEAIARKHESLRSAFFIDESSGEFVQAVTSTSGISLEHKVLTGPEDLAAVVEAHKTFEFDLATGQTIKFLVLFESPSSQYILICYHHIVLDGFSAIMFLKDLDEAYSGRTLVPPAQQAIDMCVKQRLTRVPCNLQDELRFWSKIHSRPLDPVPLMPFSKVRNRQVLRKFDVVWHDVIFDAELTRRVKAVGARLGVTPFQIYLSTLAAFLSRCLDVEELNIGVMDSNRLDTEDLGIFGYFMNFLPLRFSVQSTSPFSSLARQTRDLMYDALANSRAPLATVIDHIKVPRSGTHHPLFQVALHYRQDNSTRSRFGDVPIEWLDGTNLGYPYDTKFDVNDTPDGTRFCVVNQKYLYGVSDAKRMVRWYEAALTAFLSDPDISIGSCPLRKQEDEANAMALAQGPRHPVDTNSTLAHRIQEMSILYPDSPAVTDALGGCLTYSEMMARSEQIAQALHSNTGLQTGDRIAVLLTAVPDLVCSLLAIMNIGLVYVPLDTRNSSQRLGAILSDCKPCTILCNGATEAQAGLLAAGDVPTRNIEDIGKSNLFKKSAPEIFAAADQVGFAMYTNGTTGPPKGVLVTHSALLNHIMGITSQFGICREVVLHSTSPESDFSLEQIFISLANGGTLVIVPQSAMEQSAMEDVAMIADIMHSEGVTYTAFALSQLLGLLKHGSNILRKCLSWRLAFSSREKVTARLRRAIRDLELPELELVSVYGPVEATISCSRVSLNYQDAHEDFSDVTGEGRCGPVMPHYSMVIVDQDLRPVPISYPGEICIGGPGLAAGYLNESDDGFPRFIDNPFKLASPDDLSRGWTRLFRSGDRGRVLEDGSVHFIGRLNGGREIMIHNNKRVNLDEIADVIIREANPVIFDAAVSWREDSGVLFAFVTVADDFMGDINVLLRRLKATVPLPTHMIPDAIVPVPSLPRTLGGVKDLRAIETLPLPEEIAGRITTGNFSSLEMRVKGIWENLIYTNRVVHLKPESDFFSVGGSSLLLTHLQNALQYDLGCSVSLPDLFQFSTIRSMAGCIEGRAGNVKGID